MIKELVGKRKELALVDERQHSRRMDCPELSLGPSPFSSTTADSTNSSSSESEANTVRKRKHACIDLHIDDPLPIDWEQCLDLKSGRVYYLNRRTLSRSWSRPREEKLDLELNISTPHTPDSETSATAAEDAAKQSYTGSNMIAIACLNCHLLVMLYRSSPSCPNCKYLNPLPSLQAPAHKMRATKPLETLSLMH